MPKKRATKKSSAKATKASTSARTSSSRPAAKKVVKKATKKAPARSPRKRGSTAAEAPLAQLERLIALMVETEVVEVEYEEAGARWRVRRAEAHAVTYAAPPAMAMPMAAGPAPVAAGAPAAGGEAPAEPEGEVFKSPMVGTFYRAPSPDAEPFSKPGDHVSSDRTLCIIEAMKVMNEIKAESEFEVIDVLVKDGESVEFGQPLFLIR